MTSAVTVLTGPRGGGKTTWCASLLVRARAAGVDIAGVASPAVFEAGRKTGIDVHDARTGDTRPLARLTELAEAPGLALGPWTFDRDALAWGDARLRGATPCRVLLVDELGTLELERGEGWTGGLAAVDSGGYRHAVVVVRPALVPVALARWPHAVVVDVRGPLMRDALMRELVGREPGRVSTP